MFSQRTPPPRRAGPLSHRIEEARRTGAPVIDLTESNPTRCGFTYDEAAMAAALAGSAGAPYEPDPRGLPVAREAVARYYAERGVRVEAESLVLASGTSEAYAHLFTLLADPGDEILVPTPGYPLLEVLTRLAGVGLVPYRQLYDDRAGWAIDLERLRASLSTRWRAIVVVNPGNPTGAFLKRDELAGVAEICTRHDLALIVDEVFGDYAATQDPRRVTTAVGHDACLTFVLNGLSKIAGLPQMKLAWIVANGPRGLREQALERLDFIADAFLSVGTPVQRAAAAFLEAGRQVAEQIRGRIDANFASLQALVAQGGTGCSLLRREGGWYAVLRLPDDSDDEQVALTLLERDGVLVHPGFFYDFPPGGAFLVVSLLPPEAPFREGVRRLFGRTQPRGR